MVSTALPFIVFAQLTSDQEVGVKYTITGQVILFLTTILGIGVQIYRENRARRWAKEDAEALARKVDEQRIETERIVRHVGNNVSQQVANKALEADEKRKVLEAKVDLQTELTKIAANGPGKHLYEDQKPLPVEVVNDKTKPVPTTIDKPNP